MNFAESEANALQRIARENIVLRGKLARDEECIRRMQLRERKWLGPLGHFFWRKPWKSPAKPNWMSWPVASLLSWLRCAHDCSDPSVACSCSGGFRFPPIKEDT